MGFFSKLFRAIMGPSPSPDPKYLAAYHESGHVLCALEHGYGLKLLKLDKLEPNLYGGSITYIFEQQKALLDLARQCRDNPHLFPRLSAEIQQNILYAVRVRYAIALAGPVAEMVLLKKSDVFALETYEGGKDKILCDSLVYVLLRLGHLQDDFEMNIANELYQIFRGEDIQKKCRKLVRAILAKQNLQLEQQEILDALK